MAEQYIKTNSLGIFYYKNPEKTLLHRADGPAAEYPNGDKALWINGEFIFAIKKSEKIIKRIR